jgi:hypothetical protein
MAFKITFVNKDAYTSVYAGVTVYNPLPQQWQA